MIKINPFALIAIVLVAVLLSHVKSCNNDSAKSDDYDSLLTEIRDIKQSVSDRDTLIDRSHDTVMYRVKIVAETIREYRTLHDTILRLQACDSMAKECELLAIDCVKNDSIHTVQESELNSIVTKQDTIIELQGYNIDKLRQKNRLLKMGSGIVGAWLIGALILK